MDDIELPYFHHAQFAPAGNAIIMVYNYDIYYRRAPRNSQTYRVTHDAIPGIIYNGIPDWLYEGMCKLQYKINLKHKKQNIIETSLT